ncbi:MAG: DMT family transporter [Bacteroidota bacterium]
MAAPLSSRSVGILLVVVGAICASTKAIAIKLAYGFTVDPLSLLALRMLFALPFYVVILALFGPRQPTRPLSLREWISVIIIGFLGYFVASQADFIGLSYIPAGLERLILFTYPSWVVLLAWAIYGQRPSMLSLGALAAVYLGIFFIMMGEVSIPETDILVKGAAWVLLAAIAYAGFLIGSEKFIPKMGTVRFTSWSIIAATLGILLQVSVQKGAALFQFEPTIYYYALYLAIVATVIPTYMVSAGIKIIGASAAAIVGTLGPVFTLILAYFFLDERLTLVQMIGTLTILAGVFLIGRDKRKQKDQKEALALKQSSPTSGS